MAFDDKRMALKATQGQVADIAIDASLGLLATAHALRQIATKTGIDISGPLQDINEMAESLDRRFDALTGWTTDDEG